MVTACFLCPRNCGVNRQETVGFCGCGDRIEINRVSLHRWEEPCLSGKNGSGTVFFSGCNLGCVFCQNAAISHRETRRIVPEIFSRENFGALLLRLEKSGAENINLVTPTHFTREISAALAGVKDQLTVPVIWNSSGYEKPETLRLLSGLVDVFLPDLKFFSPKNSARFAGAEDYFQAAAKAIGEMVSQQPEAVFSGGMLKKGVMIRHLVLPGAVVESCRILDFIAGNFPGVPVSVMSQYFPAGRAALFPPLDRKVKYREYAAVKKYCKSLGLSGYFQQPDAASGDYTPDFTDPGFLSVWKTEK